MEGFGSGEMERGSVAGIELLTRTSLNSLRDANQVSSSYLWESLSQSQDDRNWSWAYLRQQFKLKDLEVLYKQYQHQLQKGYFSIFLVAQFLVTAMHVIALLLSSQMSTVLDCMPDMVVYSSTVVLCVPLVAVVQKEQHATKVAVFVTSLLTLADLAPILYRLSITDHSTRGDGSVEKILMNVVLRPAYPILTLLAVYCFLPFSKNRHAIPAALGVSLVHLMVLAKVTYKESSTQMRSIFAEIIFFSCINFLGLYFRFVNEVIIRRTFLDRRACVESTLRLNYEKEQEEQLMLSILPKHIAARVKDDIRSIFQQIKTHQDAPLKRKPFSELYVEEHDNVSILYADVVNFSKLTVSLHPKKLVETLNELFTRFDEASEDHGVLRIKFLGDSYYCVSGVPQPNPKHAEACVDLALDMISIIKEVRHERELDVDMRIGVHSGKILSGVLGVCKWQYDVWSRDVIIANHMEQSGKPGKVHVSQQTRDSLGHCYTWEPSDAATRDLILEKYNINTFFVTSKHQCKCDLVRSSELQKREFRSSKEYKRVRRPYDPARHTMFMENNLVLYQQMLRRADECMANAIKQMPVSNYSWTSIKDVNPICLTFEHLSWELPFLQQPDPLFKFYIAGALLVLICIRGIQALDLTNTSRDEWISFALAGTTLLLALPLSWTHFIWNRIKDPHQEMDVIPEPESLLLKLPYRASLAVVWSNSTRTFLYLVVTFLLASFSFLHGMECRANEPATVYVVASTNGTDIKAANNVQDCITPWHITETTSLALLMCFLFLRVHFQLKLLISSLMVTAHIIMVLKINPQLFHNGATWNAVLSPQVSHILSVLFLIITIHLLDRQAEYMLRLDYRWKRQLIEEQEEASTTRTVNKMLLQNILPIHVADLYLNTSRPHEDLYHEQYDSVAVMFASLIDTSLSNSLENERNSLEVINYIICGFDKVPKRDFLPQQALGAELISMFFLYKINSSSDSVPDCCPEDGKKLLVVTILLEASGHKIEKIKVAGRTYMAACGLEPGRRDSNCLSVQTENHAVILTRFAIHMMKLLDKYNSSNNFKFQLTVGIAHGAVAAGVVGSQKPLYDIWGDAVNLASRMDSTGVPTRIQVPEETANILEKNGVPCDVRGETFVKGKGYLKTYFVSESYKLQVATPIMGDHTALQVTKL